MSTRWLPVLAFCGSLCWWGGASTPVMAQSLYYPRPSTANGEEIPEPKSKKKETVRKADNWVKYPPIWSIPDVRHTPHPYSENASPTYGPGVHPGGPAGQFGQPYYYHPNGTAAGYGGGFGSAGFTGGGFAPGAVGYGPGLSGGYPLGGGPYDYGYGYGYGYGLGYGYGMGVGYAPGSYGPGTMAAAPGNLPGNPYLYHFGPGFYRYNEAGHYRFPAYSYRRPWYYQGYPSYNRDTNIPW